MAEMHEFNREKLIKLSNLHKLAIGQLESKL